MHPTGTRLVRRPEAERLGKGRRNRAGFLVVGCNGPRKVPALGGCNGGGEAALLAKTGRVTALLRGHPFHGLPRPRTIQITYQYFTVMSSQFAPALRSTLPDQQRSDVGAGLRARHPTA